MLEEDLPESTEDPGSILPAETESAVDSLEPGDSDSGNSRDSGDSALTERSVRSQSELTSFT